VQLGGSLLAMLMIANLQYSWTLFVQPLRTATGWNLSAVQWAFTLFIIFETWVMPIEGWMIDKMGPRIFITIAGVLCGVGWTALGYVTELWQLYLFYSIAGVGAAFVYSGAMATALKWFPDKRGLAAGIIAAGFGGGSALFIPIIAGLIKTDGYQKAFVYTGIIQAILILAAAQVLRKPTGEYAQTPARKPGDRVQFVRRNDRQFTTPEMLRTPHFYLLYLMFVMMATGGLLVTAQAAPVAKEWGISMAALTAALALDRVANGVSRIFWGWVSDRLGREYTMALAFLLQSMCLVSVVTLGRQSGTMFTVALILVFFTWGEVFSLFPSTIADYYGMRNATSNYCFLYSAKGVAAIIGGGVGAMIFEYFGSWTAALYGSAVLAALSGLMALGLRMVPLPQKEEPSMAAVAEMGRG
jgi:OFA family oxalate/formate antiporter-like MFS transporter